MKINKAKNKKWMFLPIALLAASLLAYYLLGIYNQKEAPKETLPKTQKNTTKKVRIFDKSAHSIDEPGSLWWIVSRNRPLPEGYTPPDLTTPNVLTNSKKSAQENMLREDTANALAKLFDAAKNNGFIFMLASGYRSVALQTTYYNNLVAKSGQAEADKYSAKPGTSEHQTGMSLDIANADRSNYLVTAFGEEPSGQWVANNAHTYGFIVRYPEGKQAVTGYEYEPWHIRYVGVELANELYKTKQTMEEFFELSS